MFHIYWDGGNIFEQVGFVKKGMESLKIFVKTCKFAQYLYVCGNINSGSSVGWREYFSGN